MRNKGSLSRRPRLAADWSTTRPRGREPVGADDGWVRTTDEGRVMPTEERGPDLRHARKVMRARRLAQSLETPPETVQKLQTSLQAKAKAEPAFCFYSLWDKVYRADFIEEAYRACRRNGGAAGADGVTFDKIAAGGEKRWLEELRQELRAGDYRPQPLLRVWIPKSNGGQRPLGIPCIRDRVVEMSVLMVLSPIFEADLLRNQYGFRPQMDAKMAIRQAFWQVSDHGRSEIVDADLSDYFSSIPHGPLMRCVSRRVADGTLLSVIKSWLTAPVIERDQRATTRCTTEAKDRHRGTPQGSPISPLLANLYFRRFLLAWEAFGHRERLDAHVINYADDLVICCRPGNGAEALTILRHLMTRLGLTVNEAKTRLANIPEESFDFLGYTVGRFYGKDGVPYIGTRPSRKAVRRLLQRINDATTPHKHAESPEQRVAAISRLLRGWAEYFNQGPVLPIYKVIRWYVQRRLQRWLVRRGGQAGTGYRQYPDQYLYETLGLYKLPTRRADMPSAKA
jgi:RNA-directed DNA polymerase